MVNQILIGAFQAALRTTAARNLAPEARIPMLDDSRGPERLPTAVGNSNARGPGRLLEGLAIARVLALLILAPSAAGFQAAELVMRLGFSRSLGVVTGGLLGLAAGFAGLLLVLRYATEIPQLWLRRGALVGILPTLAAGGALVIAVFWLSAGMLSGMIGGEAGIPWAFGHHQAPAWKAAISVMWYLIVPTFMLHAACGYLHRLARA